WTTGASSLCSLRASAAVCTVQPVCHSVCAVFCRWRVRRGGAGGGGRQVLSHGDILADPSWLDAPVAMTSNSQRPAFRNEQLLRWARRRGVPVVCCRYPLLGALAEHVNNRGATAALYERHPQLVFYLAVGAPAHLSKNLSPERGLANGSPVVLHSLTLHTDE